VPQGSVHFALQSLELAKRILIAKAFRPGTRAPAPNSYWLTPAPEPPKGPTKPKADPVFAAAFAPRKPAPPAPRAPAPLRQQALVQRPAAPISGEDLETSDRAKGPVILTALRFGQCHWPLENSPTGADQIYCAKPSGAEQYCPPHKDRLRARSAAK
jgi:hypothetical protein